MEFFENLLNNLYIILASIYTIYWNVIKVYDNKNGKFFYQNFFNIAIKTCEDPEKIEKYYLVVEIAIQCLTNIFLLVNL